MEDSLKQGIESPGIEGVEFVQRCRCPLHASDEAGTTDRLDYLASVSDSLTNRTFRILRCASCGAGLTDPFPTENTVGKLYQGRGSASNFDPIRGTVVDRLKDFFAMRDLRSIKSKVGSGTSIEYLLDYGTGNGRFSLIGRLAFKGCRVDAVDFDVDPPPMLVRDGIHYMTVDEFLKRTERYDLILLRHVLEHVHDPINFLTSMARRLSPEGAIYVEVPNLDSAYTRLFGSSTNSYSVPYHLFHFDAKALERVAHASGLHARITQKGMPLAGGILAALLHQERTLVHQLVGILLHPVQLCLDAIYGRPCLAAICTHGDLISGTASLGTGDDVLR